MSQADDLEALQPVADALTSLGVGYYIGGSAASSVHGFARSTLGIDIVADIRREHVDRLVSRLASTYYVDAGMIRQAIDTSQSISLIHLATMYKIDVFVMRNRPFDRLASTRAKPHPLSEASSRQFPMASPEDVILSKLEWYRAGGEVSERQWRDVIGVMRVQREVLNRDYLGRWAAELNVADLLHRAWREVEGGTRA
jgi:hypothetical protein